MLPADISNKIYSTRIRTTNRDFLRAKIAMITIQAALGGIPTWDLQTGRFFGEALKILEKFMNYKEDYLENRLIGDLCGLPDPDLKKN